MSTRAGAKNHNVKAEDVEGAIGYLPGTYMEFIRRYPEIGRAYADLSNSCHKAGPLDKKTRRLIKLGIAIGINSDGAVRSHTRRALEEGIITGRDTPCSAFIFYHRRIPLYDRRS